MAATPSPDTTDQLIQMLFPSTGYFSGAWSQNQPSGYVDPQYAYSYAAPYGYPSPVSSKFKMVVCVCVITWESGRRGGVRGEGVAGGGGVGEEGRVNEVP